MEKKQTRLIPGWLRAALTTLAMTLVLVFFFAERSKTPPVAFAYDVSSYASVDPARVTFKETGRIPLDIANPAALAVATDNRVYVAGENAVVAFSPEGKEVARFGVKGRPDCIAVRPDGKLLIGMRNHIEVRDVAQASSPAAVWPDLDARAYLTSIAADDENVYAADAGNRVVLRFDYDGKLLGRIGKRDPAREIPGFVVPSPYFDVALDPQGSLWVVNPGKHGLENYRPNGDLVSSWYRPGMGLDEFCGCCNPIHVAFRSDGSFVTAEKGLNRVKVYGPDTKFLGVVVPPEALGGPENAALSCDVESPIKDLAVDQKDRVLVLDGNQKAIRIFEKGPS